MKIYRDAYDKINKYELIDNINYNGTKLLKEKIQYSKENWENVTIRIFGTSETLSLLNSNVISLYYQDGIYIIVPSLDEIKVVIILLGKAKNINNIELILISCFSEETTECNIRFYNILKNYYHFIPQFITNDFGQANLNALEKVYNNDNIIIITCFFHLVKAWWKKASKLGLRRKNFIKRTKMLIFNFQMLSFMEYEEANKFYIKLKNLDNFKDDIYETFFSYFGKNWFACKTKRNKIKSKFPFSLWSYYEKLNSKNNRWRNF